MILVNGSSQTSHTVLDRGLAYGDGLFETIAVKNKTPQLLALHWQRLQIGCERLKIQCPDKLSLNNDIERLLERAGQTRQARCVIKLIVTRGIGGRGYRFKPGLQSTRIMMLSRWPVFKGGEAKLGVKARLCKTHLSAQPLLAGIKHLNRLEQVMARAEWSKNDVAEGIMPDRHNNAIEGTMSNLFLVDGRGHIFTPSLSQCGVEGVQRENILSLAKQRGLGVRITDIPVDDLSKFHEAFLTNSVIGVWPVTAIDNLAFSIGPVTRTLQALVSHD